MMDATEKMDNQYRHQRFVYDLTRKYYLFGRDAILKEIDLTAGECLLEVGCGTARNLRILAKRFPRNRLLGIDASRVMLETAETTIAKDKNAGNISLSCGLAQEMTSETLGCDSQLDHILFSYVLSMIPEWPAAVEHAITQLKPGGTLHIVDFSDQHSMPSWFRSILLKWLDWFNVHPDPHLPNWLRELENRRGGRLEFREIAGGYAMLAHYHKNVI